MSIKTGFKSICPARFQRTAKEIFRKGRLTIHRLDEVVYPQKMKYFCPCCRLRVREFVRADYLDAEHFNPKRYETIRQDVLCPACMSLPRHRILAAWFDEHKDILKNKKVLYFAPENSMTLWMKRNGVKYTTADLYNDADLKLDIQNTKLPDNSLNIVICNHVLEHVNDFRQALNDVYRILDHDGVFICSFPIDANIDKVDEAADLTDEECYNRFGQKDHKRVFGVHSDELLVEAGFGVDKICGENFPEEILPVIGPADYDINILFYCWKKKLSKA